MEQVLGCYPRRPQVFIPLPVVCGFALRWVAVVAEPVGCELEQLLHARPVLWIFAETLRHEHGEIIVAVLAAHVDAVAVAISVCCLNGKLFEIVESMVLEQVATVCNDTSPVVVVVRVGFLVVIDGHQTLLHALVHCEAGDAAKHALVRGVC